jgi:hypothetical protein
VGAVNTVAIDGTPKDYKYMLLSHHQYAGQNRDVKIAKQII